MVRDAAISEVQWYTMNPISSLLSARKAPNTRVEERASKKLDEKLDLKKFHGTMLYAGVCLSNI